MSTDKISNAYKAMGQDLYKRPKQKTITAESLGIHINGPNVGERRGKTSVQKMSEGYRLHKEQLEAKAKEQADKNKKDHEKALKTLQKIQKKGAVNNEFSN